MGLRGTWLCLGAWAMVLGCNPDDGLGLTNKPPAAQACGDGVLDAQEQCDDGNTAPDDGCDSSCAIEAWSFAFGGTRDDRGRRLAVLSDGFFVSGGIFRKSMTLAEGTATETTLTASAGIDSYLARFARDGSLLWAQGFGGGSADELWGLAAGPNDEVVVTGFFYQDITFAAG